jgi:hypothetical protein
VGSVRAISSINAQRGLAVVASVVETGATVVVIVVVSAAVGIVPAGVLIIRRGRVLVVTVAWIIDEAVVRWVTGVRTRIGGVRWVGTRIGRVS